MHSGTTGTRILTLGHYQPARVLRNDDLAAVVDTSDEWIRTRVGIAERRIAAADESVTDMAVAAAGKTLARSGMDPADIDLVVVATCTAMQRMPNIAARVAHQLAMSAPAAFDLNVACAGFCYALATADQAIRGGASGNALVVGVDKMSDFLDWTDRSSCVIFGDGAGAAVVTGAAEGAVPGIGPVVWGSEPERGQAITLETTGPAGPPALFRQDGQSVYRWATGTLAPIARAACARAGVDPAELAGVVTHQANLRIIDLIVRGIGARDAIVARDVVESGNTSAASVPLALSKLIDGGELTTGDPVLLLGFGAGLSYASQVVRCP
ncbi:beta-ketoacyl-ACP synthase III [Amycolatopsis aidingensis]|uniref:beta-ketoacyl-ACP synthase III n=1 Tax=Amycolatopsis aidingensis TaxID=2842453 RepID=UPI001C0C3E65|nr:beta-ketoacyl-ACP synthase III [Amycolatopsis aidingensis]